MAKPRSEWGDAQLVRIIEENLAGSLFHLTDWANARTIEEHGLLSKDEAARLNVAPKLPGGNELTNYLDARDGLSDYVFLSFFDSFVMPTDDSIDRFRRPLVLKIDPGILFLDGVMVRLGRGYKAKIFRAISAVYEMDWEIWDEPKLREDLIGGKARWKTFLNYEVLVPKCVPSEYILGVAD